MTGRETARKSRCVASRNHMRVRGDGLADVFYHLTLKKGVHQLLRGNAPPFDRPIHGGPGWAGRASQGKQAFHRPPAKPLHLLQAEDIVVIVDAGSQIARSSVKKEQIFSVAIERYDISCREIVAQAARRGSLPFAEHAGSHDEAAIRPAAVMKIFDDEIARFVAVPAMRRDDFHRRNLGREGFDQAITGHLSRNAAVTGRLAVDQFQRPVRATDDSVEKSVMAFAANPLAQRDRAEIDPLVTQRQMERAMCQLRQAGQARADAVARDNGVVDDERSMGRLALHADSKGELGAASPIIPKLIPSG